MAIVCVVGENLRSDPTLFARAVTSLDRIPLRLVSQAASRRNITFVLRDARRAGGDEPPARRVVRSRAWIVMHADPSRRPRQDGAARRSRSRRSTAARSPASSIPQSPPHSGPIDDPTAGATSTWRSTSRRRTPCSTTCPRSPGGGINVVLGTTGWQAHEAALRAGGRRGRHRHRRRAELLDRRRAVRGDGRRGGAAVRGRRAEFGAFLHEAHHAMKKDAPSGTALLLKRDDGRGRVFAGRSTCRRRAPGFIPGTHTIGFDGRRNRLRCPTRRAIAAAFARGALTAARWVKGRQGWFTMHDVLGIRKSEV